MASTPARLAFALVLLGAGLASAQLPGGAAREQAKRLKEDGARALDRRDFASALARFEAAYRAYPSPNLRYNMGLALTEMGRPLDAILAFEDFLTNATDAPRDARDYAQKEVSELDAQVGHVTMTCSSEGAEVAIDGKPVGFAPLPGPLRVDPGRHDVTIAQPGFHPFRFRVDVGRGNTFHIDAMLVPADRPVPRDLRRNVLAPAIVAGATALSAAIGAGLRIDAQVAYANLKTSCAPDCARTRWASLPAREYAGDALLGVAGVLAVVDLALWVVELRKPQTGVMASRVQLDPIGLRVAF